MALEQYLPMRPVCPGPAVGYASNEGLQRYLLEAESTTGFVAWKLADGTTLVSPAPEVSLTASTSVSFWACTSYTDTTPDGKIISLDCHANSLTRLDVRALASLKLLDCCYNHLTELDVTALPDLQVLDVDNNLLTELNVRQLDALRILNCAGNRLTKLDLSGLTALQILDCSENQIDSLKLDGCSALQDCKSLMGSGVDRNVLKNSSTADR